MVWGEREGRGACGVGAETKARRKGEGVKEAGLCVFYE